MFEFPEVTCKWRSARKTARLSPWVTILLLWCLTFAGLVPVVGQTKVNGNIAPNKIEIDATANLTPGSAGILNATTPGNPVDWQKDTLANTDGPTLTDGVAVGIIPNMSGATGGTGHWYGARLVDTLVGGKDSDIFLSGGKVNDISSWNIGPGTVGSSKFDYTQAYMANNQQNVFFGMERAGNSGTTAFDFEFNQLPPASKYVPVRSLGDKLVSFELHGSGGDSGSVQTYIFNFDGSNYVPLCDDDPATPAGACPAGLFTSIDAQNTPAGPWGYVNSQGNWVLGNLDRRIFAEAQVPLSIVNPSLGCGGSLFVQIRTRSSSALGSDAKDASPIFQYVFGGPDAQGALSKTCGLSIQYDGSSSKDSIGGTSSLTYSWQFQKNSAADGSGSWSNVGSVQTGVSGTFDVNDYPGIAPGRYRAILTVTENGSCTDDVTTNEINIYSDVGGTASLTPGCDSTFTYSATGTGGNGPYSFNWTIYKSVGAPGGGDDLVAKMFSSSGSSSSGTLDVDTFNSGANGEGNYYAVVTITDAESCAFPVTTNAIDVRHQLTASASKNSNPAVPSSGILDSGFIATMTGSTNALAGDSLATQWQYLNSSNVWTNAGDTDLSFTETLADIFTRGLSDNTTASILGDGYALRRGTLQVRLHAERTLNGNVCQANSTPVTIKALKAIDP